MKKDNVFTAKYKDGELIMSAKPTDYGHPEMIISYKTTEGVKKILKFGPEIMNTKAYGPESIGVFDSESAELGEVAYQMHGNDSIDRPPFPYGIICCVTDDFDDPEERGKLLRDLTFVSEPGFMDTLADLCIQFIRSLLRPIAPRTLPLYFVYYGVVEMVSDSETSNDDPEDDEEDEKVLEIGRAVFNACKKSEKFGVCRCVAGLTTDESCYLAIAGQTKDKAFSKNIEKLIKQVEEYPEEVDHSDEEDEYW